MAKVLISEVQIYPIKPKEGLLGFVSLVFDGRLSLNSIAIHSTPTGDLRLLFPEKVLPNGKRIETFYPINRETYDLIR